MPKLYAFGSSTTIWMWPSWAEIMAYDQGMECVNYGMPGAGNSAIQHRMLQSSIHDKPTAQDWVVVLWTTWSYEDRVVGTPDKSHWLTDGNILNTRRRHETYLKRNKQILNERITPKWVDQFWSEEWDVIKNCTAIIMAQHIMPIKVQMSHVSFIPEYSPWWKTSTELYPQKKYYESLMPSMIQCPDIAMSNDYNIADEVDKKFGTKDNHPDIMWHASVCEHAYKQMGMDPIKSSTWDWIHAEHERIKQADVEQLQKEFDAKVNMNPFING